MEAACCNAASDACELLSYGHFSFPAHSVYIALQSNKWSDR